MRKRRNYLGQKFNKLTIVKIEKNAKDLPDVRYLCNCDCGNTRIVRHNNIIYGKTKSCGCIRNAINAEILQRTTRKPLGTSTSLNLYKCYQKSAKNRKHIFELTLEQFKHLTKQNCYYCNSIPKNEHRIKSVDKDWEKANTYIYNGIDRIDSKIGYILENCVSCCKQCNQGKMNYKQDEFYDWIKRIYKNLGFKN